MFRLWDLRTGQPLGNPFPPPEGFGVYALSRDGSRIIIGHGGVKQKVSIMDTKDGRITAELSEHDEAVVYAAFGPKDTVVVTGSAKLTRAWNVQTGAQIGQPMVHGDGVIVAEFMRDGPFVAISSADKTVRLFNASTGECVGNPMVYGNAAYMLRFSRDGKLLASLEEGGVVTVRKVGTGEVAGRPLRVDGNVSQIAISPDGRRVLTASTDKTARVWDVLTGRQLTIMRHEAWVEACAFSPDGNTVLTGGWDNAARLWDSRTGEPMGQPLSCGGGVVQVVFSPDGRTVFTRGWGWPPVRVWDIAWACDEMPADRLTLEAKVFTRHRIGASAAVESIPSEEWQTLSERLAKMERQ